jgi:hypothetical protein
MVQHFVLLRVTKTDILIRVCGVIQVMALLLWVHLRHLIERKLRSCIVYFAK